jgi:hypothetical protein
MLRPIEPIAVAYADFEVGTIIAATFSLLVQRRRVIMPQAGSLCVMPLPEDPEPPCIASERSDSVSSFLSMMGLLSS